MMQRFRSSASDPYVPSIFPVSKAGILEDPHSFLTRNGEDLEHSENMSHPCIPRPPAPPSLTDTQTAPTMSRGNSIASYNDNGASFGQPFEMLRVGSLQSSFEESLMSTSPKSVLGKRQHEDIAVATSQPMLRSQTNLSTRSNSSNLSARAKERLAVQNQRAQSTNILPRPVQCRNDHDNSVGRTGATGAKKKEVIDKPPYQRPKHPRVYCKACEEYPEGFRGEHELRRHQAAKHAEQVEKWVCQEAPDSEIQPEVPLSRCKACQGSKKYGAYYNAGAHLRRAHFNKKPRSGSRRLDPSQRSQSSNSNGQEWPPMDVLKKWMRKVVVSSNPADTMTFQASTENQQLSDDTSLSIDIYPTSSPDSRPRELFFDNMGPITESGIQATSFSDLTLDTAIIGSDASESAFTPFTPSITEFSYTLSSGGAGSICAMSMSTGNIIPNNFVEDWTEYSGILESEELAMAFDS